MFLRSKDSKINLFLRSYVFPKVFPFTNFYLLKICRNFAKAHRSSSSKYYSLYSDSSSPNTNKNRKTEEFTLDKKKKSFQTQSSSKETKSSPSSLEYFAPPLKPQEKQIKSMGDYNMVGSWTHRWNANSTFSSSFPSSSSSSHSDSSIGYEVPYNYKIVDVNSTATWRRTNLANRDGESHLHYTDFSGMRYPTLNTAANYRYWKDTGLDRLLPRIFPIKLPMHRRVDPLLREYIYFLHSCDPQRFSLRKIGERYKLKEKTVGYIYKEFSLKVFLHETDLCTEETRRIPRSEAVMKMKEVVFSQRLGYNQIGDEEVESEDEEDEFKGWKSTFDWVEKQAIQVEAMKAFPMPEKRNPIPKRVDVDVCVDNTADFKIINWIDPNEAVVF